MDFDTIPEKVRNQDGPPSNQQASNVTMQPINQGKKCIYCGNFFEEYDCGCPEPETSINQKPK